MEATVTAGSSLEIWSQTRPNVAWRRRAHEPDADPCTSTKWSVTRSSHSQLQDLEGIMCWDNVGKASQIPD